jgi:hypothetical protein
VALKRAEGPPERSPTAVSGAGGPLAPAGDVTLEALPSVVATLANLRGAS